MVPTLVAHVLEPVWSLFDRQLDAVRAVAEAGEALARPVVDVLGPGGVVALAAVVAVPVLLVLVATLSGAARTLAA